MSKGHHDWTSLSSKPTTGGKEPHTGARLGQGRAGQVQATPHLDSQSPGRCRQTLPRWTVLCSMKQEKCSDLSVAEQSGAGCSLQTHFLPLLQQHEQQQPLTSTSQCRPAMQQLMQFGVASQHQQQLQQQHAAQQHPGMLTAQLTLPLQLQSRLVEQVQRC